MNEMVDFYKKLAPVEEFIAIGDTSKYAMLPDDWHIVITDVVNSTEAIEAGKYKDVNTSGGLAAIAMANALGNLDFPFVFGGDGVTILLPESQMPMALDVLASTRRLCHTMFGLQLRVGSVPMKTLAERGYPVHVLKFRLSDKVSQAILVGSGVEYAEFLIKDRDNAHRYLLADDYVPKQEADFSGFVCIWRDIPSPKGETVSLIVKLLEPSVEAREVRLVEVLQRIKRLCGSEAEYHPLALGNLSTTASLGMVQRNALVFNHAKKNVGYWRDYLTILGQSLLLTLLPRTKTDYVRHHIMEDADYRKFDGSLKMVIACTPESRQNLASYFNGLQKQGFIAYGMHVSDKALMTCFLQSATSQIHFIDAAGGGYALAAKQLKQQLKQ